MGQLNSEGLYDVVFCHIGRQEEFDFFLFLTKVMKGGAYTLAAAPQIVRQLLDRIPQWMFPYLEEGNIIEEDEEPIAGPNERGSPYTDLTQDLGDRLTEYELVEDLIERGTLAENTDGTLYIRLEWHGWRVGNDCSTCSVLLQGIVVYFNINVTIKCA